jgi:GT2 family glycosyltransferase
MPLSVIIPNLNSPVVDRTIASLKAQTALDQIAEIVIVGLDQLGLVQPDPLVRLLDTGTPLAAAAARNRGAATARCDTLLFVDADCALAPDALEQLLAALTPEHGAVSAAVVPEHGDYWRLAGNLMAFADFLTVAPLGARPCLPSFCLLVPRAVFEQVGPFDESFPGASGEDLDLTFRIRRAGFALCCVPGAAVLHRPTRSGMGDLWRRAILPRSEALWLGSRFGYAAAPLLVVLAWLYVTRLVARNRYLLRFVAYLPGMVWAQLAWYYGIAGTTRSG